LKGVVNYDSIVGIIASTACPDLASFHDCIGAYCTIYSEWKKNPTEAKRIALQFWNESRIDQPRLRGESYPNIADGHWQNEAGEKIRF